MKKYIVNMTVIIGGHDNDCAGMELVLILYGITTDDLYNIDSSLFMVCMKLVFIIFFPLKTTNL